MKAYTRKNEGEPSDQIIRKTDITGPSAPLILNLTCQSDESIYVHWARPALFWGSIDYYYINYRRINGQYYEEMELSAEKNRLESWVRLLWSLSIVITVNCSAWFQWWIIVMIIHHRESSILLVKKTDSFVPLLPLPHPPSIPLCVNLQLILWEFVLADDHSQSDDEHCVRGCDTRGYQKHSRQSSDHSGRELYIREGVGHPWLRQDTPFDASQQ